MACAQSNVDWQSTKNTILERNRHMFNNSDMSDISFTCEGSDKKFYAHKYVLGTSSGVFHAMFYGELAEKDSIVRLSDTNEESFEQFLRFLYTEECTLTTDNVVGVTYLAKKYIVPSLNGKCLNFLLENVNPENVLDVLEQATRFDEKELEKQCWEVIQYITRTLVTSDAFNNISQTTLASLLEQDNLNISEVELFQAVLKWIDFQCSRKNLKPTGENRRSVIGDAIYGFRFFAMSQDEFVKNVSKSGLLTAEELVPVYEKFIGVDSSQLKWKLPNRNGRSAMVRYCRFLAKNLSPGWSYGSHPDILCFSVSKVVLLVGVRLFGDAAGSNYQVTLEVKEAKVTGTYTSERNKDGIPGFDVMLETPILLKRNDVVTLSAKIEGPTSFCGEHGTSVVTLEGVSVKFGDGPPPHNETYCYRGQFHEIILSV